jgi:hypothetical protein
MSTGGGTPAPQQVTTTTSNLPDYAQPYFENVVNRAQAASYQPYQPYGDQRIAGFSDAQQQAQQGIMGMQAPSQFGTATGLATASGLGSLMGSQYNPMQQQAQQVGGPMLNQYGMSAPQTFGNEQAQRYMSPYIQNVLDVQKRNAITDAKKGQLVQNLNAAGQGTYGGSRQLLAGMERERNLGQQLGDIDATGLQSAFQNAQQQFNADTANQINVGGQNLNSALQTQQLGAQTGLQALMANQSANLQAQQGTEQSRQFGANLGLQGYGQALNAAQGLGQLGTQQQGANLNLYNAQNQVGAQQQGLQQQGLDMAYADFLRQRDYPMEQLGYYNNILRGLPVGLNSTATTYAQPPSIASQVAGVGLGSLGLANLTRGG